MPRLQPYNRLSFSLFSTPFGRGGSESRSRSAEFPSPFSPLFFFPLLFDAKFVNGEERSGKTRENTILEKEEKHEISRFWRWFPPVEKTNRSLTCPHWRALSVSPWQRVAEATRTLRLAFRHFRRDFRPCLQCWYRFVMIAGGVGRVFVVCVGTLGEMLAFSDRKYTSPESSGLEVGSKMSLIFLKLEIKWVYLFKLKAY